MSDQPDWTEQARRLVAGLSGMLDSQGPLAAGAESSGDCRWCPLCQAAAVLRGERPEVSSAMADILTTAAAALRSFAGPEEPASDVPAEPASPADGPTGDPATEGPIVQR